MPDRRVMTLRRALLMSIVLAGLASSAAHARGPDGQGTPRGPDDGRTQRAESQGTISLGEAVSRVRRELGGRLIDARLEGSSYSLLWELPDRRIVRVRVDASSGAIQGVEGRGR